MIAITGVPIVSAWSLPMLWLLPLIAAAVATHPAARWAAALGALPALATGLALPAGTRWEATWLLLGTRLGIDAASKWVLVLSAALWLAAALQAAWARADDARARRLRLFLLLAMSGNFLLLVGQDLVSFYMGFVVMGLAVYGLIAHRGDPAAARAGRVYVVLDVIAQIALFEALLLIARHTATLTPSPEQVAGLDGVATGLLLLGFAIKAGLIGVHVWVPLAARSAPASAGAVVLGAFVMAAAIGWTRFLPIGHEVLSDWGFALAVAGVATMLYVLPVGLVQTDPKTVIGYTSVGLSGVLATLLAVALAEPARAAASVEALTLFAGYQALSIAALLLGVGLARRVPAARAVPLLAIPALILAGAPYTWGALAHVLADETLLGAGAPWSSVARLAVLGGWFGTGLLTWRVLALVGSEQGRSAISVAAISLPWLGLIVVLVAAPFMLGRPFPPSSASWPVLAGALLALPIALWRPSWPRRLVGRIPPGDLLAPLARASSYIWHRTRSFANSLFAAALAALSRVPIRLGVSDPARDSQVERNLALWPVAGTLLLGIATVLLVLLAL